MKKIDKLAIFLIPIGVALNFIGAQIAMLLKLPVYLDAIGTIVVGALCGGIPGAVVGVISNTINSITYPAYVWYGIISAIYGILAAYLSRRKVFCSLWKTVLASLLFATIGGVLNSCITWILFGFNFATGYYGDLRNPAALGAGIPEICGTDDRGHLHGCSRQVPVGYGNVLYLKEYAEPFPGEAETGQCIY